VAVVADAGLYQVVSFVDEEFVCNRGQTDSVSFEILTVEICFEVIFLFFEVLEV